MKSPFSLQMLLPLLIVLVALAIMIQIGILSFAFQKLGLSADSALAILLAALIGSAINIPLFSIKAIPVDDALRDWPPYQLLRPHQRPFQGRTIIAVNVGGCIIPLLLVIYLFVSQALELLPVLLAIGLVTWVSYAFSRAIPGMGIAMPILIAPLAAVLAAGLIYPEQRGAVAYICGTLGVLIGADLLRLKDIRQLGAPVASIGGAGTFDGIFFTGIIAVLLA
ncbi:MAG: DUF1614 domain-containing protein [Gammaproteobacteria bacterium]|nr:DUF1614 domain-containing protein [Gammaproteobacteria bacterium]